MGHFQKLGVKAADHDGGALDQAGHLVQQDFVVYRLRPKACGCGLQLPGNVGTALIKTGDHRAIFVQGFFISIGMRDHHRRNTRFKTVALGAVACTQAQRRNRNHRAAMQGNKSVGRAHKAHGAPTGQLAIALQLVLHDLGDGQFGDGLGHGFLQAFKQAGTAHRAVKKQGLGFAVHALVQAGYRAGIRAQGLQFFQQRRRGVSAGIQANGDGHQFLRNGFVGSLRGHCGDVHTEATRRRVIRDHRIGRSQTLRLQAVRQRGCKSPTQIAQRLGRQLLHQQFNQQVFGSHAHAAFFAICAIHSGGAMGKPKRSRLS